MPVGGNSRPSPDRNSYWPAASSVAEVYPFRPQRRSFLDCLGVAGALANASLEALRTERKFEDVVKQAEQVVNNISTTTRAAEVPCFRWLMDTQPRRDTFYL